MSEVDILASFVERARFADFHQAVEQLKIRVLDTIGVAIGALGAEPICAIRKLTAELGGRRLATLIGGGKTAPDRVAFFNGALSRYLDFMDSYIAKGRPAILPTTWVRYSPPPKCAARAARIF